MVVQKAQMDLEAVEDIKVINRMTLENLQLDYKNNLNEAEDRRIQYA